MKDAIWKRWTCEDVPLRVGVSSCLIGSDVRPGGEVSFQPFLTHELSGFVEWRPLCPEVELGLGRRQIHLRLQERSDGEVRLLQSENPGVDLTEALESYARAELERIGPLDGFVLDASSASCGSERVRVHSAGDGPERDVGTAVFARVLREVRPELPVEAGGRLNDRTLRANFLGRLFGHNRWRALLAGPRTPERLEAFHDAHELLLRAHDGGGHAELSRLLQHRAEQPVEDLYHHYARLYHATLSRPPAANSHIDLMKGVLGRCRRGASASERRSLRLALDDYRRGAVPLVVVTSMLRFYIGKYGPEDLAGQVYLDPFPGELLTRRSA